MWTFRLCHPYAGCGQRKSRSVDRVRFTWLLWRCRRLAYWPVQAPRRVRLTRLWIDPLINEDDDFHMNQRRLALSGLRAGGKVVTRYWLKECRV